MRAFMTLGQRKQRQGVDDPWPLWGRAGPDIHGSSAYARRNAPDGRLERAIDAALAVISIAACAVLAWVGIVFP